MSFINVTHFSGKVIVDKPDDEEKDTKKGIITYTFSIKLTVDMQNKQVFIGAKVSKAGKESIQYSKGIDIGTISK
jgi:hypothetical protein